MMHTLWTSNQPKSALSNPNWSSDRHQLTELLLIYTSTQPHSGAPSLGKGRGRPWSWLAAGGKPESLCPFPATPMIRSCSQQKKRGSFLSFPMETALYLRHYQCSAPGYSNPTAHPPLTSGPSSLSSPQQVAANLSGRGASAKPDS